MKRYQDDAFAALLRVELFCEAVAKEIDEPGFHVQSAALSARIQTIWTLSTTQVAEVGRARGGREMERVLRLQLRRRHLAPLRQVAKAIAVDAEGFEEYFRVPHVTVGTQKLLAVAGGMRENAARNEQRFIDAGLPPDFLAALDAAIAAVRENRGKVDTSRGSRRGATAGLGDEIKRGRATVSVLDTIVRRRYEDDAGMLAKWRSAKRIRLKPGPTQARHHAETEPSAEGVLLGVIVPVADSSSVERNGGRGPALVANPPDAQLSGH